MDTPAKAARRHADSGPSAGPATIAQALVGALHACGLRRMFGVPGGGASLDLIEALRARGLAFVLARHECAAVFMAAATAELDGSVGAALTTKGPGTANAVNGVAHASLDRCAVVLVTDGFTPPQRAYVTHQWFDQRALLAPISKGHDTLETADAPARVAALLDLAREGRRGPVHVELTGATARTVAAGAVPVTAHAARTPPPADALERVRALLVRARRPIVVAGLEACDADVAPRVRRLVDALGCPALVTYKAKGVVPDASPAYVGIFTGGAAEQEAVNAADLVVLVGVDPVELILQPWAYTLPVAELGRVLHPVRYVDAQAGAYGDLAAALDALAGGARPGHWDPDEITRLAARQRAALEYRAAPGGGGLTPQQVVELAAQAARALPAWPRATVDAGAHMFSATAFWPCEAPRGLLISNGLATMGFALPAAIASALHEPDRTTVAFTGDGGLLMCLGELATAVQQRARVVVVVFNDGALSLIDIKQQQRKLPAGGVHWPRADFAGTMRALGGRGWRVSSVAAYRRALREAFAAQGPALIDVRVDPSGYPAQLEALRG